MWMKEERERVSVGKRATQKEPDKKRNKKWERLCFRDTRQNKELAHIWTDCL